MEDYIINLVFFLLGLLLGVLILIIVLVSLYRLLKDALVKKDEDVYNLEYPADFVEIGKKNAPTPPKAPPVSKH